MSVLEQALRDDLEARAPRSVAVLDPLRLRITNLPENHLETCSAPFHPQRPELGRREFPFSRELFIEREDFAIEPPKGFFRLFPGNLVRLRYAHVIRCTGFETDADGRVSTVLAELMPDSRSGTPGADAYKVKGNLHWVSAAHALPAEVRLYERLFTEPQPGAGDADYLAALNPDSRRLAQAWVEPSALSGPAGQPLQFERHGYFVTDSRDSRPDRLVFNRCVSLKDTRHKG